MKKFIEKTRKVIYRAYENVFGKLGGLLACGAFVCLACSVIPAGVAMLCFSALSLTLCAGKLVLEDHEVRQAEKYFPEKDYTVENYVSDKQKEKTENKSYDSYKSNNQKTNEIQK